MYQFDAIVIGAGQAGPSLAGRLTAAGHEGRARRAQAVRRHLRQHRLHADQDAGRQRLRRASGPARAPSTASRSRARSQIDMKRVKAAGRYGLDECAHGRRDVAARHGRAAPSSGPRPLRRPGRRPGRRRAAEGAAHLHQRRRPRERARHAGRRHGRLPHQHARSWSSTPSRSTWSSSAAATSASSSRRCTGASAREVTVVEKAPRLIAREDEDVSEAVREILDARASRCAPSAKCIGFEPHADGVAVGVDCTPGHPSWSARTCCWRSAAGPTPTTSASTRPASRPTRAATSRSTTALATNVPGIWALGDCNGRGAFTHTAYNDFEIVAANLLDGENRRVSDRIPAYALYIDPPLGRVGMTETRGAASGPASCWSPSAR